MKKSALLLSLALFVSLICLSAINSSEDKNKFSVAFLTVYYPALQGKYTHTDTFKNFDWEYIDYGWEAKK